MIDTGTSAHTMLNAGIAAGLLFFIVPTIEIYRRPAFDIGRHAISMLSLGDGGWIMKTVFILCGVLTLACAIGLHLTLARGVVGIAAPVLIGLYGCGLVIAGLFDAPAGLGFPAGTPIDQQPVMSTAATLHGVGFMVAFSSLIITCFVLAYHFFQHGQSLLAGVSIASGVAMPALVALGMSATVAPGIAFYWAAMIGWAWLAVTILALPRPS